LWLSWVALNHAAPTPDPEQLQAQARAAFESWQYGEALKLYRLLDNVEASVRVGDCLFQLGRYGEALDAYADAANKHAAASAKFFPRLKAADCLVKMGRRDDARRLYDRAKEQYQLTALDVTGRIEWLTGK
jgi:tetratricopeptide (TPR) repeat protein